MKIQLKRSSVLDGAAAKKPLPDQLEYGELAVNYNATDPAIFIKNSTDDVIQIAGANSLSAVPDLAQVTEEGNWTGDDILIGGSASDPVLQLNSSGNVITTGYFRGDKSTNTDSVLEASLNDTQTAKLLANGTLALGGTLDSTLDQSQATIVVNGDTGNIRSTSLNTSGALTSGGQLTVSSGGADLNGTINIKNSLNVTEGTALTGDVTMGNNATVTGDLTVTGNLISTEYSIDELDDLPTV